MSKMTGSDHFLFVTLLTCAVTVIRAASSVCVSSYDVILKLPLGEALHLGDGKITMQFEERLVLHSKCGLVLMAADLPINIVLIKQFTDPKPVYLDSVVTSVGEISWVKEKTPGSTENDSSHVTQAKITLSLVGAKLETKTGVRLTLKWRTSRDLPWEVDETEDVSRISWKDFIEFPSPVTGDNKQVVIKDLYSEASLSYTFVVPRTRPHLTPKVIGNVMSGMPSSHATSSWLGKFEPSGNEGYGSWDVFVYDCKLNLDRADQVDNVVLDLAMSLHKTASIPFGAFNDIPDVCEPFLEKPHLLPWHYLVAYAIYMFLSRMLFGLDAVFASKTNFAVKLVRHVWKAVFTVVVLTAWGYIYTDVRAPSCDALYSDSNLRWTLYFCWTLLPSVAFVLLVWPLWLNTMANEQPEEVAEQLIAMRKGEQQRERGRSALFALFCKALAPALYLSVIIFQFRVFVTDARLIDVKIAALLSLGVCLPVWLSRGVWRPEPKYMSDRLLLSTFTIPVLMACFWRTVY